MDFHVLGPVEVLAGGRPAAIGEPRQRAVLAVLLLEAGRPVSRDTLIDRVWGEAAPPQARRSLYAHIARLRRALARAGGPGAAPLTRATGGYRLDVGPDQVDVLRFRDLLARSREAGRPGADRAATLRAALALWRGDPLAGVAGSWADRMRDTLRQDHEQAVVAWAHAELELGAAAVVLAPLTELVEERPLLEPAAAALILALHAAGRSADALDRFDRTRRLLRDELGIDPGPELRAAHRTVLRGEPPAPAAGPVPAGLPADVTAFTGRADELAACDRLLAAAGAGPLTICLTGTAGVGKTALAVRWAHRVRDRFPDGQLYLNLRGYDPEQPVAPIDALGTLLTPLAGAGQPIPAGLDARAAHYRTLLAGRRMLIVLDNASTVAQLRHLLPGAAGCLVLITSRDSLAGLVSVNGAHRIVLDLLPAGDAARLLRHLVGVRVDREPRAAARLAEQCAGLPLALRIAAELAATRPATGLAALTRELTEQQRRLDLLSDGADPHAAVSAVFSWSLRHLPASAVRLFTLLGLHPGPHPDPYAAAALAGAGLLDVRRDLAVLLRAHLLQLTGPDRYGLHDLLRAYAVRLAADPPAGTDPDAAVTRLLDHYLAAAAAAMRILYPGEAGRRPAIPESATPAPEIADAVAARRWLRRELPNLAAVAAHAAAHDRPVPAVRASALLYRYLDGDDHTAAVTIHSSARAAAGALGDAAAEAYALNALAHLNGLAGRPEIAVEQLEQARRLSERAGDELGQARALGNLAGVDEQQARYADAAARYEQAMLRYRRLGDLTGEAHALTRLASVGARLGRDRQAREHAELALTLHRRAGHTFGEAWALNSLGEIEARSGHHARSADRHRRALTLFRVLGHRSSQAETLDRLAACETRLGRYEQARDHHRQALELFRALGDRIGQASARNGMAAALAAAGTRETGPGEVPGPVTADQQGRIEEASSWARLPTQETACPAGIVPTKLP
ncbi:BTAD domain-containing putative transcriptional regulator [Actinoplanes sp. L3-i22]|uniref:AfsR/SARP family transcriptional regulator n=1 Tax=Actinoplanes sp. L3-i22 TaxID=2836373 RepID=UPI001C75FADC|nr:BTAD domain-containing putative transcriptional regulator [Actinoplanes sp. L3-i22]BCY12754.1 XRE family transcriptional regulator [Actinoplanes sp. L3-i22]